MDNSTSKLILAGAYTQVNWPTEDCPAVGALSSAHFGNKVVITARSRVVAACNCPNVSDELAFVAALPAQASTGRRGEAILAARPTRHAASYSNVADMPKEGEIMDPVTTAALITLVGNVSMEFIKNRRARGGGAVAIGRDGSQIALRTNGRQGPFTLTEPPSFGDGNPVPFKGNFVPADTWAQTVLHADQPVLVVIEDEDEHSRLDSLVAVMPLEDAFEGLLYPGVYRLGAYVFLDDDFTDWSDLDGGALIEFSVDQWEPPFRLTIPIQAAPPTLIHADGVLAQGHQDLYEVHLQGALSYQIFVNTIEPNSDMDLYVYDENGNLVDKDDDPDSDALCTVEPRWTGPFTISVQCHSGYSHYELLVITVLD